MLTGRVSSFINVAGKKVQPAEVEDVLRQMPGVRDVRVVAAADAQRGEQVVACVVAEPGAEESADDSWPSGGSARRDWLRTRFRARSSSSMRSR